MNYLEIATVYSASDGEATRRLYARLEQLGPKGAIAVNLFRACKCSERAKLYRKGPGHKTAAYERKDWSIKNLAGILEAHGANLGIAFGWGVDEAMKISGDPHHHVIYVEIPGHGQVSFHNGMRYGGPDYAGKWDGARKTAPERICRWIAELFAEAAQEAA